MEHRYPRRFRHRDVQWGYVLEYESPTSPICFVYPRGRKETREDWISLAQAESFVACGAWVELTDHLPPIAPVTALENQPLKCTVGQVIDLVTQFAAAVPALQETLGELERVRAELEATRKREATLRKLVCDVEIPFVSDGLWGVRIKGHLVAKVQPHQTLSDWDNARDAALMASPVTT